MIGVFDSGVGGLGIYREVKKLLPSESVIYLADSKNCPYGEKSDKKIKEISLNNTRFLINKGCNIIVIACNTASTVVLEYIRYNLNHFPPTRWKVVQVVGVVPVVKTASEVSKNKRIGILATKKTVESKYLHDLVEKFCSEKEGYKVYYQEANELVRLVEFGIMNYELRIKRKVKSEKCKTTIQNSKFQTLCHSERPKEVKESLEIIKKYLQPFIKAKVDVIALGCTHFLFIRKEIQEIMGPKIKILDSNGAVARQVKRIMKYELRIMSRKTETKKPKYRFYTSGNPAKTKPVMEKLLGEKIDKLVKIK